MISRGLFEPILLSNLKHWVPVNSTLSYFGCLSKHVIHPLWEFHKLCFQIVPNRTTAMARSSHENWCWLFSRISEWLLISDMFFKRKSSWRGKERFYSPYKYSGTTSHDWFRLIWKYLFDTCDTVLKKRLMSFAVPECHHFQNLTLRLYLQT